MTKFIRTASQDQLDLCIKILESKGYSITTSSKFMGNMWQIEYNQSTKKISYMPGLNSERMKGCAFIHLYGQEYFEKKFKKAKKYYYVLFVLLMISLFFNFVS